MRCSWNKGSLCSWAALLCAAAQGWCCREEHFTAERVSWQKKQSCTCWELVLVVQWQEPGVSQFWCLDMVWTWVRSVHQALLEVAAPPHVSTPMEESWVGWGLVFDHSHQIDKLLCHHETISSVRAALAWGNVKFKYVREGETAFPVAVADGCPTYRSGFKLVAFILLLCLMFSRCSLVCGSMRGNLGAPCRV